MAWVPSAWAAGQLSNPAGQLVLWATSWWRPRDLHGRGWYLDTGVYSAEPAARRPGVWEFGQKSRESYLGEKTQVYWISRWGKYDRYSPILSILPHPPHTLFLHPSLHPLFHPVSLSFLALSPSLLGTCSYWITWHARQGRGLLTSTLDHFHQHLTEARQLLTLTNWFWTKSL